jgi:hypothetical protein
MSAPLDAAGGPAAEGAADLLVTAGPETRVGLVHATVNTTALSLYLASVIARAQGQKRGGQALALAGLRAAGRRVPGRAPVLRPGRGGQPHRAGAASAAVDPVLADTELADGELCRADAAGVPVLLYRTAGTDHASRVAKRPIKIRYRMSNLGTRIT